MTDTKLNIEKEVLRILGRDMTKSEAQIFNALRRDQPGLVNPADIARILRHRTRSPSFPLSLAHVSRFSMPSSIRSPAFTSIKEG